MVCSFVNDNSCLFDLYTFKLPSYTIIVVVLYYVSTLFSYILENVHLHVYMYIAVTLLRY